MHTLCQIADLTMDSSSSLIQSHSSRSNSNIQSRQNSLGNLQNRYTAMGGINSSKRNRYSHLIKKSLRILNQSKGLKTETKKSKRRKSNVALVSESDCILVEDPPPEVIVIDDDDDDDNENSPLAKRPRLSDNIAGDFFGFSPNEKENLTAVLMPSSPSNSKQKDTGREETNLADVSKSSLESGEIDESTLIESENIDENKPKSKQEDNLTLFYEDITPNTTILKDEIPLYRRSSCNDTIDETLLPCDVVFVSSTPLSCRKRKRKKKRREKYDDSVIFVDEIPAPVDRNLPPSSNTLEFVPLDSDNGSNTNKQIASPNRAPKHDSIIERITKPFKRIKENLGLGYLLETAKTPNDKNQPIGDTSILFTASERKRNAVYNSNTYNPNKEKRAPGKRMVIIDGSNIAYAHSCNREFSVKGIQIALEYFEKMGHEAKAVVPQYRLQKHRSSDAELLEQLHREGKIVLTPCKNLPGKSTTSYDDRFILQLAVEFDAAIVSNDNYRDLLAENSAFKKIIESRVIGYTWCKDMFMLPKDPYGRNGPSLSVILNRT